MRRKVRLIGQVGEWRGDIMPYMKWFSQLSLTVHAVAGILEMLPVINHTFGQPTLAKVVDSLEQQTNGQNVWAR
jgi:hypothetical protein